MKNKSKLIAIVMTVIAAIAIGLLFIIWNAFSEIIEELEEEIERLEADADGVGLDGPLNEWFWDEAKVFSIQEGIDLLVQDLDMQGPLDFREEFIAFASLLIRNETGDKETINKDKLYLVDNNQRKYFASTGTGRASDTSFDANPYRITAEDIKFNLGFDFKGGYEDLTLVYEGGMDNIRVNLSSIFDVDYADVVESSSSSTSDPIQIAEYYGDSIYGHGTGGEHELENGVTLSVHSIETGRVDGTAGVQLAVLNETDESYYLNPEKMYLMDPDGEKYPVTKFDPSEDYYDIEIQANSIFSFQEGFHIPEGYYGDYEGWLLIYGGEKKEVQAHVYPQ